MAQPIKKGGFDPKAYLDDKPQFDPKAYLAEPDSTVAAPAKAEPISNITPNESFATGTLKGLTLGLSKYPLAAVGSIAEGIPYKESLKLAEDFTGEAKRQNPGTFTTGDIAGTLSPQGLGGIIFRGATAGAKTLSKVPALAQSVIAGSGAGAATGGISAGTSGGSIKEGAIKGGIIGGALPIAAEGIKRGVGKLGELGKDALASLRNIRKDTLDTLNKRPEEVAEAVRLIKDNTFVPAVARDVQEKVKNFVTSRMEAIDEVLATSKQPISVKPVKDFLDTQIADMSRIQATPLQVKQVSLLKQQQELLKGLPDELPAADFNVLKKQVQDMAQNAFNDTGIKSSTFDKAMLALEEKTRDQLNKAVPQVKQLNGELAQGIKIQERLGLKNAFKGEVMDPNKMQSFLKTLGNDAKKQTSQAVEEFDRLFGTNIKDTSELYRAADDIYGAASGDIFSAYKTGKALLGPALGGVAGTVFGPVGTMVGTGVGAVVQSPSATVPLMRAGSVAGKAATSLADIVKSTPFQQFATTKATEKKRSMSDLIKEK